MNLFEIDKEMNINLNPQALLLGPINKLWERDKTKSKTVAKAEISILYFYCDFESDFSNILDEEERIREVVGVVTGVPKGWKPDATFMAAIEFYNERQETTSMSMYKATRAAAEKVEKYIKAIDLDERDKAGKPIHNIASINKMIADMGNTVTSLDKLEKQVRKEQQVKEEIQGGHSKAPFEDGVSGSRIKL